tara:strand:+ start:186 stop:698 length:513 start_codon:yes stop_codon:yes gene_type:complete
MPTNKVLFFSVDYLKENTVINKNVDPEIIEPLILLAQNIRIEPITGTLLYNEIVSQITNDTLTTLNKTLFEDFIQPALEQWALYEVLPFINYKLTNKAVSTKNSDNSESVELDELHYLRQAVREHAEEMGERLIRHLKRNCEEYPLYDDNTEEDEYKPLDTNYFGGIVFD